MMESGRTQVNSRKVKQMGMANLQTKNKTFNIRESGKIQNLLLEN